MAFPRSATNLFSNGGFIDAESRTAATVSGADAFLACAKAKLDAGLLNDAIGELQSARRLDSGSLAIKTVLAHALIYAGRHSEATTVLEEALQVDPTDVASLRMAATCYQKTGRFQDACDTYSRLIAQEPGNAEAFGSLAEVLCLMGRFDIAMSAASIAIRLDPNRGKAHFSLALAHETLGHSSEAIASYGDAIRCEPDLGAAHYSRCRILLERCEWSGIEAAAGQAMALTYQRGKPVPPFGFLAMTGSLRQLYAANQSWAAAKTEAGRLTLARYEQPAPTQRSRRIKIGYLSADFHVHATTALIAELLELHDKTRFETFGYSIGFHDNGAMRRRVIAALDHFVDLSGMSHLSAAEKICQDDIDILIDLKGYTYQSRPEILAYRPAPIQVNFLGYPSTMGASFIDYIIGDKVVIPFEHQAFYAEKIVHLPNSYQPNDRTRKVSSRIPHRAECDLPVHGFVFCCFNRNYKLNAPVFDIWMRLLADIPGSVLWILETNDGAPGNLRREAAVRGVDPMRIVFAPKLPVADHMARMQLADLFLDTSPCGAHTTASEALWVGLPVLTCLGEAFAARVGASLLQAVGLPELVTPDLDAYRAMAYHLATNQEKLQDLRMRLQKNRLSSPLFDTRRYVRSFESALVTMADVRDLGRSPKAFAVDEDPR